MDTETQILIQGFSAFAGAFFAFLFLRLAEFLSKIYQRQVQHYNSLVKLETQLNELGGVVHDNIYLIPFFKKTISSGNIYFSRLQKLPIDKSHYENLYDIDLINELFSFNYQLRKLNDDINNLSGGYSDIKNAYIQHNIERKDYIINAQIACETLTTLEAFFIELENKIIKLLAKVVILAKKDAPLGTKIMHKFIKTNNYSKIKKDELEKKTRVLQKEIEESKTQSQKEIEEVIKKYRQKRK